MHEEEEEEEEKEEREDVLTSLAVTSTSNLLIKGLFQPVIVHTLERQNRRFWKVLVPSASAEFEGSFLKSYQSNF